MICKNCGSTINDGAKFCLHCGSAVQPTVSKPVNSLIGFSKRVNDPEILSVVKKNRKAAKVFALILVPLPLIIGTIYGAFRENLQTGLLGGGFVSLVFLIFALYSFIKERAKNTYEGVVVEKRTKECADRNQDSSYTKYVTVVKTTDGKKKKIVETERGIVSAYHYLRVGDRFRYHPQFSFPYELYDKTQAPYLACVSCGTHNPIEADRCSKCGTPLLK